jgi:hypothetical protein
MRVCVNRWRNCSAIDGVYITTHHNPLQPTQPTPTHLSHPPLLAQFVFEGTRQVLEPALNLSTCMLTLLTMKLLRKRRHGDQDH